MHDRLWRWARVSATAALLASATQSRAGENTVSNINLTQSDGGIESGWVVQIPAGPSDFFSVAFPLGPSMPSATRNGTLKGVSAVHPHTPRVGFYRGGDLSHPISEVFNPTVSPDGYVDLPDVSLASLPNGFYMLAMQFPPGDSGLLGIGGDTNGTSGGGGSFNPIDSSSWSTDGFQTPAIPFTLAEWELHLVIDPRDADGAVLRVTNNTTLMLGDYDLVARSGNDDTGISFYGPNPSGDFWVLFLATPTGLPIQPVLPVLSTVPDPGGDYARLAGKFPPGFTNVTFHFVAAWGNASQNEYGFSNVVAIEVP